jgi:NADH:ubiquinone oxidoreductase subunit 2 (subunit N)
MCIYLSKCYFLLEKIKIFEYSILILLSVQGSLIVMMTTNLFVMYIALELQNLCFYALAALKRFNNFSTEAGLKYFLLGSFSSSLLLFSISLIYGILGTLDIFDLYYIFLNFNYEFVYVFIFISMYFFLCGFFFKIGAVPFH